MGVTRMPSQARRFASQREFLPIAHFWPKVPNVSTIRVLFLGPARVLAGIESASVPLPTPPTVKELRRCLEVRYPTMARALPTMRLAINMNYAMDDAVLQIGDEVAVIPPVSGGSHERIWVELFRLSLPMHEVRTFIGGDTALGGIVIFEGVTRSEHDAEHGALHRLDYEAYEGMALSEMRRLAEQAMSHWPLGKVALLHRMGTVLPGETSVIAAVAAGHRAEAFDACRFLIDTLKQDVPIWKIDVFSDGHSRFVKPQ